VSAAGRRSFGELRSRRLVLRRFRRGDAPLLAAYRNDPAVAAYQGWEVPYPLAEAEKFVAEMERAAPGVPGTWFQFAVGELPEAGLVGDVALRTTRDGRQAELGFSFAASHQGRGYATEAVREVLRYAFEGLALHRVFARTDARNQRAQRLLGRVGFRREGELREATWSNGEWCTELLFARLASEREG